MKSKYLGLKIFLMLVIVGVIFISGCVRQPEYNPITDAKINAIRNADNSVGLDADITVYNGEKIDVFVYQLRIEFSAKGYTSWIMPKIPEGMTYEEFAQSLHDGKIKIPPKSNVSIRFWGGKAVSRETVEGINLSPGIYPVRLSLDAVTNASAATMEDIGKYRIWGWKFFDTEIQIP